MKHRLQPNAIKLISIVGRYDEPLYPKPVRQSATVADILYRPLTAASLRPSARALLSKRVSP
jgi:hypothetical protein